MLQAKDTFSELNISAVYEPPAMSQKPVSICHVTCQHTSYCWKEYHVN